jgi:hypothetical protein
MLCRNRAFQLKMKSMNQLAAELLEQKLREEFMMPRPVYREHAGLICHLEDFPGEYFGS